MTPCNIVVLVFFSALEQFLSYAVSRPFPMVTVTHLSVIRTVAIQVGVCVPLSNGCCLRFYIVITINHLRFAARDVHLTCSSLTIYSFITNCFLTLFRRILYLCLIQNEEQFVDDSFPPIGRSLHYDGSSGKVAQWLRLNKVTFYNREEQRLPWTVFRSPKPFDICQGVLGNCWYLLIFVLQINGSLLYLLFHLYNETWPILKLYFYTLAFWHILWI